MGADQWSLIAKIIVLCCLIVMSIEDIRYKEIHSIWLLILGIVGIAYMLCFGENASLLVVLQFLPGTVCLFLAWVTKEQIGYGDAMILLFLGCYLKVEILLNICMIALTFAGLVSLCLLVTFKKSRKFEIPLIPFVLAAFVIVGI